MLIISVACTIESEVSLNHKRKLLISFEKRNKPNRVLFYRGTQAIMIDLLLCKENK